MDTLAIAFVGLGVLLIRQVVVGRVKETPSDMRDFATAALSGDTATMQTVFSRRGSNVETDVTDTVAADTSVSTTSAVSLAASSVGSPLVAEMTRLGTAAKGYVWGATGPSYYDCSGLVWRALKNLGLYSGPRFTSATFEAVAPKFAQRVNSPAVGDIIVWPGHHIGVAINDTDMYSARSPSKGIGPSSISGDSSYFHSQPHYWRVSA